MTAHPTAPVVAGWREWVALPDFAIAAIKAKLDTGARTSALHAVASERYTERGAPWVRLEVLPRQQADGRIVVVETAVIDERTVTDSSGHRERRIVVATTLRAGLHEWLIELTITNRDALRFRMLLGRSALAGQLLVDPERSYVLGRPPRRRRPAARRRT